jgi:hypothetical protein
MAATEGMNLILQHRLLEAAFWGFTNVMGDWFWFAFWMLPFILIYIATDDYVVTVGTFALVSAVLAPFFPAIIMQFIPGLVVIGITIVLWRLVKR